MAHLPNRAGHVKKPSFVRPERSNSYYYVSATHARKFPVLSTT
jgi:hypothetical protein